MRYVFTCIAEKKNDMYFLSLPDFNMKGVCDVDLYSALKAAHNIIIIETYLKEAQRVVIPEPKSACELAKNLTKGQWTTCITVDTDVFAEVLELYEKVRKEDLQGFLEDKEAEYQVQVKTAKKTKQEIGTETTETDVVDTEQVKNQPLTDTIDFEDDIETAKVSGEAKENNFEKTSTEKKEQPTRTDVQPKVKRQKPRRRYNNRKEPKSEPAKSPNENETNSSQGE